MPIFFKNIKKLFSKPDHSSNKRNGAVQSKKAQRPTVTNAPLKDTAGREKKPAIYANPFMDHARAKSINATVIEESIHQINYRDIDNNANKIVKDLHQANYESYLVGGCVRDLLLSKRPKDFDVTTGAHPEQAHKVFNRSRLIGRRFKLLHVRFGRDLIEVATFRASHDTDTTENQSKQADSGMILRDNVYGTIDQDAVRRDFTINALYYDIKSRCIYDFTNGFEDIAAKKIRMIGNPSERYREDPVRMLRAVRFAAKLDFEIEKNTASPIKELAPMLFDIAPARLFDEVLKLLQSGHGNESLKLLKQYDLLQTILPQTSKALDNDTENACQLIGNALKNTDRRIKQRKSVSPGFLYAVLLWPSVHDQLKQLLAKKRIPPLSALHEVSSKVILEQIKRTSIPKRFSTNIREIWELQFRLTRRPGNKADQLLEHPRFRAAYDLLLLREKSGEDLDNISAWWTDYQTATPEEREKLVNELNNKAPAKKKKKVVNKTAPEKPVFEKFDVVEQVKPQSKPRPKRAVQEKIEVTDKPKSEVQPSETAKPIEEHQQTALIEKPQQDTPPKEQQAVVESPVKAQAQVEVEAKTPSTINATDVMEEKTSTFNENDVAQEPKESAPEQLAVNTSRKKPRRSRAKNDPRNN